MADQDDNDDDDDITEEVLAHGVHFDAACDVRGGGTGREFVENLHGTGYRQGDKWLDPVGRYGPQTGSLILLPNPFI